MRKPEQFDKTSQADAEYISLVERRFPLPLILLVAGTGAICALFIFLIFSMATTRQQLKIMNENYARSSQGTENLMLWDVELTELAIDISQTSNPQLIARYHAEMNRWDDLQNELADAVGKSPEAAEPLASLERTVEAMIDIEAAAMSSGTNVMDQEVYHELKKDYASVIAQLWSVNSRVVASIARYRDEMLNRTLWLIVTGLVLAPLLALVILRLFDSYRDAMMDILASLQHERMAVIQANVDLQTAYDKTLEGWVAALDLRDKETEGHSIRVTAMAVQLAREFGLSGADLENVRRGALLHDIGKLGVPDSILLKPGPLDPDERRLIEQHPVYAYDWLKGIAYLHSALAIPYGHHERWDGRGYPRKLKGEEIPLAARIFAVIDVWDALRSDRPYRSAWPEEKVMQYLLDEAGSHFDPAVVETFVKYLRSNTESAAGRLKVPAASRR